MAEVDHCFKATKSCFLQKVELPLCFIGTLWPPTKAVDAYSKLTKMPRNQQLISSLLLTVIIYERSLKISFKLLFSFSRTDMPSYHDMAVPIYQRQLGVLFFDQQNVEQGQSFEIYSRQCHVGSFKKMLVEPIYPSAMEVPSMMELLDPQHTELDDDRFNLLKFIINEKILKDADLQAVPQCFFLDVLTLTAMKAVGAVSADEADVFLFTVMKVKRNEVPEDIEYPPTVDGRAFILAFAFGKFCEVVSNILETLGLFKLQASWI